MARKYSKTAAKKVKKVMEARNQGTLRSGPGGKGGKVTSRKQAIAIGLSEARRAGIKLGAPKKGSKSIRRKAARDIAIGQGKVKPGAARSRGAKQAARTRNRLYRRG